MAAYTISYSMDLPEETIRGWLEALCEVAVQYNIAWLRANPQAPCCVSCADNGRGLRYEAPRVSGSEVRFATAPELLERGRGTCHELAAYDCAHKRIKGEMAKCKVKTQGNDQFHVVIDSWGTETDPSRGLNHA